MRSALLFCLAAVVATAVAAPSPCGPDCSSSPEVLPDDTPAAAAACYAGPEVDAERWAHARMGNHRAGEELADRPPLRTAAGLEVRFDGPGDAVLGDFAHTGCRNGATLRKLEVWGGDDDDAAGVRLTFRDGEEFAAGVPRGCYTSRDFAEGERVTLHRQSRDGRRAAFAAVPAADPAFRLGGDIGPYDVHHRFDLPLPHAGLICGVSGTDGPGGLAALDFHFAPRAEFSHIVIDRSSFTPDQVTVTDHQPDINTINLEREPVPAERSLHTRAYTYKVDSGLGYWAETSVRVTDPPEGHPGEGAAPFDVDYRTFQGTREFALEAPPETIKFEIPPRSECVVRVKERVANAFHARWTGTETYYFEDGRTYSIKTGGTLRGFDVMARKTAEDCFPVGLVHSWHEKSHDWEEQCVAAKCSKDGDCCGDLECIGGRCKSGVLIPPAEPPLELVHPGHVHTWLRQCAGARCKADSDCCGDMVCNKSAKTCVSPFLPYHLPPLVPEPEVPIYHEEVVEEEEEEEEEYAEPKCCAADVSHDDYDAEPAKPSCCGSKASGDYDAEPAKPSCCEPKVPDNGHEAEAAKPSCCGSKASGDYDAEPAKPSCCEPKVPGNEHEAEAAKPLCCGSKTSDDYDAEPAKPSCCEPKVPDNGHEAEAEKASCCGSKASDDYDAEPAKPSCCGSKVSDDYDAEPAKPSCCETKVPGNGHEAEAAKASCCGSKASDDNDAEPAKPSCCKPKVPGNEYEAEAAKPSCCGSKVSDYEAEPAEPSCCKPKVSDNVYEAEPAKPSCCGSKVSDGYDAEPPKPSCCASEVSDNGYEAEPAKPSCCKPKVHGNDSEAEPAKPSCCGSKVSDGHDAEPAEPSCCGSKAVHDDAVEPEKPSCCESKVSDDYDAGVTPKLSCCASKVSRDHDAEPAEPPCCAPKVSGDDCAEPAKPSCCGSKVSGDDCAAEPAAPSCLMAEKAKYCAPKCSCS